MLRTFLVMTALLLSSHSAVLSLEADDSTKAGASLEDLENRLAQLDTELENIAHLSFRSDSGSIGFRSNSYYSDHHPQWVEIDLSKTALIDEIVLVPVIRRDSKNELLADGLPDTLTISAGLSGDRDGTVVATVEIDQPRTAPLIIPLDSLEASWIRIDAPSLNTRGLDKRYTFQLAEILVFSGEENVALHSKVTPSDASRGHSEAWGPRFLVDGHMPYIMDTARGDSTKAFIALGAEQPSITIDLQDIVSISRLHLHSVDQSSMIPQAHFSDYGLPRHLKIEGAIESDFSDAKLLLEAARDSPVEAGPIMMWNVPETVCRYVRITAPTAEHGLNIPPVHLAVLAKLLGKDTAPINRDSALFRLGFAEIEVFSEGQNVALRKEITLLNLPNKIQSEQHALTDGSNLYGTILKTRDWMHQLARRHELENERPQIVALINDRLNRQRMYLNRMYWISGVLTVIILGGLIYARRVHLHKMKAIKKRIAADLHDELGANLHAIGLFGDLAKMEAPENQPLNQHLDEIRKLTERTASATRYFSQMLDTENYHENLIHEMKQTADRFLADLKHESQLPKELELPPLSPRKRMDLYLFYKECLTNIIRHADASEVSTVLEIQDKKLLLTISDNGIGLNGQTPPSLKRRAQLMHGKLSISQPKEGGSSVRLELKT